MWVFHSFFTPKKVNRASLHCGQNSWGCHLWLWEALIAHFSIIAAMKLFISCIHNCFVIIGRQFFKISSRWRQFSIHKFIIHSHKKEAQQDEIIKCQSNFNQWKKWWKSDSYIRSRCIFISSAEQKLQLKCKQLIHQASLIFAIHSEKVMIIFY